DVERGVRLFPELEPVTLVIPGCHALGIHAEGNGGEPLDGGLPVDEPLGRAKVGLDLALGSRLEAFERLDDLAARKDLDPQPPARAPRFGSSPPVAGARPAPGSGSSGGE